jgi:3-phosphoshikimate 1-carboxyvinyltransferase
MEEFIGPRASIRGRITPPGDKSISHRALIFASMAWGPSSIVNCATGRDVQNTRRCLETLGIQMEELGPVLHVRGEGFGFGIGRGEVGLDAENSATTMRLLLGSLAPVDRTFLFRGDESLNGRPMDRVAEPLRMMGAEVDLEDERHPPVKLRGRALNAISYSSPVASAQVKGAIVLAALRADGTSMITEPYTSRDHTERILPSIGGKVSVQGRTVRVSPLERPLVKFSMKVPGDISSAAFLIVAACLSSDGDVVVQEVGLNPTRLGFVDALRKMGAEIYIDVESDDLEPMGRITVRSSELRSIKLEGAMIPRTIDELPLIAVAATRAVGRTVVSGAAELRTKEADRISALVEGLRAIGANVEEFEDGFAVTGPSQLAGGLVDARGDHRLALAFAVAGLISKDGVRVRGWEATGVSYPSFDQDLAAVSK